MKLIKWIPGRQLTCNYEKCKLWSFKLWKFGFDAYLLKYKADTILPWHKDPVENGKHWRLNMNLKGLSVFMIKDSDGLTSANAHYGYSIETFRPDIHEHTLHILRDSKKLSLGFVKYD